MTTQSSQGTGTARSITEHELQQVESPGTRSMSSSPGSVRFTSDSVAPQVGVRRGRREKVARGADGV